MSPNDESPRDIKSKQKDAMTAEEVYSVQSPSELKKAITGEQAYSQGSGEHVTNVLTAEQTYSQKPSGKKQATDDSK